MKKILMKYPVIFSVFIPGLFFWSCETPDTNAPTVNLLGADTMEVVLNGMFMDPGAEAYDKEEGDLTENIQVTTKLNTDLTGTYTVYYTVSDQAGNVGEATREVIIYNQMDSLADAYNAVVNKISGSTISYPDSLTISHTKNHYLETRNFMDDSVIIELYANNDSLLIENQEIILYNDTFHIEHQTPGSYNTQLQVKFILDDGQSTQEHELIYTPAP